MIDDLWILDEDGTPEKVGDILAWATWRAAAGDSDVLHVARTQVGDLKVSTVFLGIDHKSGRHGPPILYETMIFGGSECVEYCERYATREEAQRGHDDVVKVAELYVRARVPGQER